MPPAWFRRADREPAFSSRTYRSLVAGQAEQGPVAFSWRSSPAWSGCQRLGSGTGRFAGLLDRGDSVAGLGIRPGLMMIRTVSGQRFADPVSTSTPLLARHPLVRKEHRPARSWILHSAPDGLRRRRWPVRAVETRFLQRHCASAGERSCSFVIEPAAGSAGAWFIGFIPRGTAGACGSGCRQPVKPVVPCRAPCGPRMADHLESPD